MTRGRLIRTPTIRRRVMPARLPTWYRWVMAFGASLAVMAGGLVMTGSPAGATSYVPVYGEGSSWSANAINEWISDVQPLGMRVSYVANGSTTGREDYINGQTDFAASDIPFQTNPEDGSAPEHPKLNSYAYMPITAGGTVFMYNLEINGQRVTNLRLSGENITKIFTGAITNWDDPALAADNPALKLPDETIVPVVRSDGAGSSFELSEWMISQYPTLWNSFCQRSGRAPSCGATSFFPTVTGMEAKSGDLGVAGTVSQNYSDGSIGYVEYSYALNDDFPVVQMLNAAGYYTEPTAQNVAVSLLSAQVDTTDHNPAVYLTENLSGVYTDPDPRTYPLSSYSYLILPTEIQGQFSDAKGLTLAAFSYYAMCQGQQQSAPLGYSPMPINLVEASFAQIAKIPGADVQNINIQSCNNPTFTPNGTNLLADDAPYPPACDKQGPTQCVNGTGGATAVATAVSGNTGAGVAATSGAGIGSATGTSGGSGGVSGSSSSKTGGSAATGSAAKSRAAALATCAAEGKTASECTAAGGNGTAGTDPSPDTQVLAATTGWSFEQTLILLISVALVALILLPARILSRRRRLRRGGP